MIRAVTCAGAVLCTTPAIASCDLTFMSCTFEGGAKTVEICLNGSDVTYAFGPTGGAADLALSVPVAEVDYFPWPGVGSSIWETVTFYNDRYSYEVFAGFERNPEDPTNFGGINVGRDGEEVANLSCDPESIEWGWDIALFDAKTAAGLCWTYGPENKWVPC